MMKVEYVTEVQNVETTKLKTRYRHDRWLMVIGGFKLLKGLLFILLGIGALKLVHRDIVDMLTRWVIDMHFDPESKFVNLLLDKAALIDAHRLEAPDPAISSSMRDWILSKERDWCWKRPGLNTSR